MSGGDVPSVCFDLFSVVIGCIIMLLAVVVRVLLLL